MGSHPEFGHKYGEKTYLEGFALPLMKRKIISVKSVKAYSEEHLMTYPEDKEKKIKTLTIDRFSIFKSLFEVFFIHYVCSKKTKIEYDKKESKVNITTKQFALHLDENEENENKQSKEQSFDIAKEIFEETEKTAKKDPKIRERLDSKNNDFYFNSMVNLWCASLGDRIFFCPNVLLKEYQGDHEYDIIQRIPGQNKDDPYENSSYILIETKRDKTKDPTTLKNAIFDQWAFEKLNNKTCDLCFIYMKDQLKNQPLLKTLYDRKYIKVINILEKDDLPDLENKKMSSLNKNDLSILYKRLPNILERFRKNLKFQVGRPS